MDLALQLLTSSSETAVFLLSYILYKTPSLSQWQSCKEW